MIAAIIPAKGGSTRLPNKNMALLNGRPMIDYTILAAQESDRVDCIYVSTDSDEIAAHAKAMGVDVIRRPTSLGGDVPLVEVFQHALAALDDPNIEIVVGFQADHPDRNVSLNEALEIFEAEGADRLMSTEADGTKNGAHYILSRRYLETGESRKDTVIVDDCTNVHYQSDLDKAAQRLAARACAESGRAG